MFTSKLNTMTGKLDWEIQSEDYDYQQELARAGFADMLHDLDRNQKYYAGLKKVITKLKSENKKVHVLDIGTGTGLLSMMAIRCGADKVTAVEAFLPMIQVAKKCIESNHMKDKIEIIEKRSTDIVLGVDMMEKANVLVTEVFDTELIGEGAISTFVHALEHLLVKDCYVIPDNAVMYIQVVESNVFRDWNWLNMSGFNVKIPEDYNTPAGDSICDLQLDQVENLKKLTDPLVAFEFSFSGKTPLLFNNKQIVDAVCKNSGHGHAILMWWVCHMDFENEILMSCAPKWAHHQEANSEIPWRDHWMQAVYFPKKYSSFNEGEIIRLNCNHDEYSLWFDIEKLPINEATSTEVLSERSLGNTLMSRNRLMQVNDFDRNNMFLNLLKKHQNSEKNLLIANDDMSLLPILFTQLNFNQIYVVEPNTFRKNCLQKIISLNNLNEKLKIINKSLHEIEKSDFDNNQINIVFSELAFGFANLPWDNLYFYYGIEHLKNIQALSRGHDSDEVKILPFKIKFKAIALQFEHLHKIRSPVGQTCGFNIKEFDKVILQASKNSDGFMEPHPLWEYPCYPLSEEHEIFSYDSKTQFINKSITSSISIPLIHSGVLNGVALWQIFEYDESDSAFFINSGLKETPHKGHKLDWSQHYKQAVQILDKTYSLDENQENIKLNCEIIFDSTLGKFNIQFKIVGKNEKVDLNEPIFQTKNYVYV